MTPFYFGTRERRLFGVYDPAQRIGKTARAAVICHPWGDEQIHAYRTLRQLALRLSQDGFHVLRFDYYGTGDSAGSSGDNDFAGSRRDVETAMAELKDMTGVERLTLVGLRLGACLAADVSADRAVEVDALVLWDPLMAAELARPEAAESAEAPGGLDDIDLASMAHRLPPRTLVLATQEKKAEAFGALAAEHVASAPPWIEERMQAGAIPVNVLQRIVHWLR
jgi:pimeloyl-ACP methyl ester carboxylesterase